jgi:hypothetical protein
VIRFITEHKDQQVAGPDGGAALRWGVEPMCAVLTTAPLSSTSVAHARIDTGAVVGLLQRSGRGNHPALIEQILTDLHAPALRQPPRIEQALGHTVAGLIGIVVAIQQAGSFKNELIRRQGPWRDINRVEITTAEWGGVVQRRTAL